MKSEFQFIRDIKDRFSLSYAGDDCAVLPKDEKSDFLITTDLLIQNVDFCLEWAKPEDIGYKSLAVSLSDIAAMGGTPAFALVSLGIPQNLWNDEFIEGFYTGWHELANRFGVKLVGGDTSRSPDRLMIDSIVLGEVPKSKAICRSGARPGDLVFVSGTLGNAAAGLRLLESQCKENDLSLVAAQLRPTAQLELANHLRQLEIVTSMIDISDGLSSDLAHICNSSAVGAEIDTSLIPIDPKVAKYFDDTLDLALNGGEDFELLFTAWPTAIDLEGQLNVTRIGTITANEKIEIVHNGIRSKLVPGGFRHF